MFVSDINEYILKYFRSMSEMMVDYAREQADSHSEVSGGTQLGRYYDDDSDGEHPFNQ